MNPRQGEAKALEQVLTGRLDYRNVCGGSLKKKKIIPVYHMSQQPHFWTCTQTTRKQRYEHLFTHAHNSTTHSPWKVKLPEGHPGKRNGRNVAYSKEVLLLLSLNRGENPDECSNLVEP